MKRPDLTEDERDELTVLRLRELLRRFGDPLKRPAKVITRPNRKSVRSHSARQKAALAEA
jgi:hypothetical protein